MRRSILIPALLFAALLSCLLVSDNRRSESSRVLSGPSEEKFSSPSRSPQQKEIPVIRPEYETGQLRVHRVEPGPSDPFIQQPERIADFKTWSQTPEFRQVKNIVPPIKGVLPPSKATLVTPEAIQKGGIVNLGFNAFLHLPKDALVDEAGNPVNEPVKISYCPLSDPVDVYLSGVPMSYDSAGGNYTFRTAGMVRLEASTHDGRQVQLKKGTQMQLDMPTVDTADTYNFYTFNEEDGKWDFARPAPTARPAIDLFIDTADVGYDFDTVMFAGKFENLEYHGEVHRKFQKTEKRQIRTNAALAAKRAPTYEQARRAYRYSRTRLVKLSPYQVLRGHDANKKPIYEVRFTVGFYGSAGELFPEMRQISRASYLAKDCKNVRDFYSKYGGGKNYHDVRLTYHKGDDHCTILLKSEKGFTEIEAGITYGGQRFNGQGRQKFHYARLYAQYLKILQRKSDQHDREITGKMRRHAWEKWNKAASRFNFYGGQYRQITLPGFASYNCDQIARMVEPVALAPDYYREDGSRIKFYSIMIFDKKVQASFNFTPSYGIMPAYSRGGFGFAILNDAETEKQYILSASQMQKGVFPDKCSVQQLPEDIKPEQLRFLLRQ